MSDTFRDRLKKAMEMNELTQSELSRKSGVSKPLISQYLKGAYEAKNDNLFYLAKALQVNPAWLMGNDVDMDDNIVKEVIVKKNYDYVPNIPILGEVACGLPMFAEQNIIGYTYTDKKDGVDFALYAHGDSMTAARIMDGDLVYIRQQSAVDNGEIALVLVDSETATIKRFYDYGDKVVLRPESFNPEHKEQVYVKAEHTISIQGKVVFIKSYVK